MCVYNFGNENRLDAQLLTKKVYDEPLLDLILGYVTLTFCIITLINLINKWYAVI